MALWKRKLDRLLNRFFRLMTLTSFPFLAFAGHASLVTLLVRFVKLMIVALITWALYQIFLTVALFFTKHIDDCPSRRDKALAKNDPNVFVPQCQPDGNFAALQCDPNGGCQCWAPDGSVVSGEKSKSLKACDCILQKHHGKSTPIGGFQPTCDHEGYFEKKQCWASTGMCWCSDKNGKRLTEPTRNDISCETDCFAKQKAVTALNDPKVYVPKCEENGTYAAMQCESDGGACQCWTPEGIVVKEKSEKIKFCGCFLQLHNGKKTPIGGFQPKCQENGYYESKQCWASTGMCWCSDKDGKKLTEPKRGDLTCDGSEGKDTDKTSSTVATSNTDSGSSNCQKRREELLKDDKTTELIPTCLDDGTYAPIQCDDEETECECVTPEGKVIMKKSDKIRFCGCLLQQFKGKLNKFGGFQSKCDEKGFYEVKQCHASSGMCWCSDKYGNKTTDPKRGDVTCPVTALANCNSSREELLKSDDKESVVPICQDDGSYAPIQCDDNGACQCTTPGGEVIKEKSDKIAYCTCFLHQHKGKQNKFGGFQPKCDEKGYYEEKQCSTSSGTCWCTDMYGNKTTERKRGDNIVCPVTTGAAPNCKNRREELLKQNDKKEPIPTCMDDGSYSPMQCDDASVCQCSTPNGQLVGEKSDKIKFCGCILHQDQGKKRKFGGFQPKCDEAGYYESKQCSTSSGMCWCSDEHGNKITTPTRGEVTCAATTTTTTSSSSSTTTTAKPVQVTPGPSEPVDCEKMREDAEKNTSAPLVPKCEPDGSFSALQCNRKKECQCWSPEGTAVTEGFATELKYCQCFTQLFNVKQVIGSFKPKCTKEGYYEKMQCSTSSGMCWCVNKYGRKLTEPARTQPNC